MTAEHGTIQNSFRHGELVISFQDFLRAHREIAQIPMWQMVPGILDRNEETGLQVVDGDYFLAVLKSISGEKEEQSDVPDEPSLTPELHESIFVQGCFDVQTNGGIELSTQRVPSAKVVAIDPTGVSHILKSPDRP